MRICQGCVAQGHALFVYSTSASQRRGAVGPATMHAPAASDFWELMEKLIDAIEPAAQDERNLPCRNSTGAALALTLAFAKDRYDESMAQKRNGS
jgi:hypothetical protein